MQRREFIGLVGGAAAWPLAARAQQPTMLVVGFVHQFSAAAGMSTLTAFRQGLADAGYAEGRNIQLEIRWGNDDPQRFPELLADLVNRRVTAMLVAGAPTMRAAKAATNTIPIVFSMGEDPVKEGFVPSLNRPGGNVTGVTNFSNELFGKRFGILNDVTPKSAPFALLVNSSNDNAEPDARQAQAAANSLGRSLHIVTARNEAELDAVFAALAQLRVGSLQVGVDGYFVARRVQIAALAGRYKIPAIYDRREYPTVGGLMSYGADRQQTGRNSGLYMARILRGEKPADLPVLLPTKFEFVTNLRTARALGLTIQPGLLAIVDEVIE